MTKPVIAAFDFDGTITTKDLLLSFLYQFSPVSQNILKSLYLLPVWVRYRLDLLSNHAAKQKLLSLFLKEKEYIDVLRTAEGFAQHKIPNYVRPEALQRIRWHQAQGHRCIIVSAGLEIYLKPWASKHGFETVLATRLRVENNKTQGIIEGQNCFGQEKVERLISYAGPRENFILYAYGDSRGDKELLASADYGFYRTMPDETSS